MEAHKISSLYTRVVRAVNRSAVERLPSKHVNHLSCLAKALANTPRTYGRDSLGVAEHLRSLIAACREIAFYMTDYRTELSTTRGLRETFQARIRVGRAAELLFDLVTNLEQLNKADSMNHWATAERLAQEIANQRTTLVATVADAKDVAGAQRTIPKAFLVLDTFMRAWEDQLSGCVASQCRSFDSSNNVFLLDTRKFNRN